MTFAAVGSAVFNDQTSALSLTPGATGHLLWAEVINVSNATSTCTALSATNITWTTAGSSLTGVTNANTAQCFFGRSTSTSTATTTLTWSSTTPTTIRIVVREFSSTVGNWALDTQGHLDGSGTNVWPSLTPGFGSGELYEGFALDSGSATAGTTSGYTYDIDATHANGSAFNPSCPNAATGPTWGDGGHFFGIMQLIYEVSGAVAGPAPSPAPIPPGLQSPMALASPPRYSIPPPPQLQPAPSPQAIPPGLQSPMSLGVPSRPATSAPPAPPPAAVAVPPPLLKPPGLQSPMSLTVPSRPATGQPPAPPPPPAPGAWQPHPPGRMSPMSLGLPMVQPPQAPSTPGPPGPVPPIPSGVVFGVQGSSGGDRDPEVRMFRTIMPGEVPVSGSALPKLHGRGYVAPPPERADDVEHLWEEPKPPPEPPGPTPAEVARREAQRAAGALYDLGRIIAPEPYVPPSRVRCGALRKIGTETLRCAKKRGHPGMHADRGVKWG